MRFSMGSPWSLRRALLATILSLTLALWISSAFLIFYEVSQDSQELFDQSLIETAHLLSTLAEHEIEESAVAATSPLSEAVEGVHAKSLFFQIWHSDGRLLYRNVGSPTSAFLPQGKSGLDWITIEGEPWRVFGVWDASHRLEIQIGQHTSQRQQASGRFALKMAVFAAFILPLLCLSIWFVINRALQPLERAAHEISLRSALSLQAVDAQGAPAEVMPLVNAINSLLGTIRVALDHAQRFTADAAHELRTPLASMSAYLKVIQRARSTGERDMAIDGLGVGVRRATHLISQLMTLARLDPTPALLADMKPVALADLLEDFIIEFTEFAQEKHITLLQSLEPVSLRANPTMLGILIRNLLDNAIRYTESGGQVKVSCYQQDTTAVLCVYDTGIGIAPEQRERVFDRFYRVGRNTEIGSGLGLSIVAQIAKLHHAKVTIGSGDQLHGTLIKVTLPISPSSPID